MDADPIVICDGSSHWEVVLFDPVESWRDVSVVRDLAGDFRMKISGHSGILSPFEPVVIGSAIAVPFA